MNSQLRNTLETIAVTSIASLLIVFSTQQGVDVSLALLLFILGAFLLGIVAVDVGITLYRQSSTFLNRFRRDQKAVAWIWATAGLAIIFTPFVYWAIGWPTDLVVTQILGQYTFTGVMGTSLTLARLLVSYALSFVLFAVVVWSFVQTKNQRNIQ